MYHIRQFRPTLYILLAIGLSAFALAAEAPGLWVLAMGGLLLNAWLVKTGRFTPLPRLLATAATLLALFYAVVQLRGGSAAPILTIGQFLVLLHLVKLYEQRANRDYAQLLTLSLLLMAAAAISTASLLFGILLFIYLFISLYCCLLFHLKVESEQAAALAGAPAPPPAAAKPSSASARQQQQRLSASIRRLTGLIATISIITGVLVFLFFPRGAAEGLFGRRLFGPRQALTGFSDRVSMDQVAQINQSDQVVAQVQVTRNGVPWGGTEPLLLRGTTVDEYTGKGGETREQDMLPWHWRRSQNPDYDEVAANGGETTYFGPTRNPPTVYTQNITLEPIQTHVMFAMAGAFAIQPDNEFNGKYWKSDGVLLNEDAMDGLGVIHYVMQSSGELPVVADAPMGTPKDRIDPRITAFARRPQVSGTDAAGRPLASLLGTPQAPPDIDHLIAASIATYLRSHFQYTLDLTGSADILESGDPMVAFLYTVKRGHCEYFAGAMTLLCQSLGLHARMVLGFCCDDYNNIGHFYTVRQNQAHAWVEVLTRQGWETFDPTSGNEAMMAQSHGWLADIKNWFDYLEYRWGASVVAYGQTNRRNVVDAMDTAITKSAVHSSQSLAKIAALLDDLAQLVSNPTPIMALMLLMVLVIVGFIVYYGYERLKLRMRAARIGLGNLPLRRRRKMIRQLSFYDGVMRRLERRGLVPPPHLTQLEFSDSLTFLPHQAYRDLQRLTRVYYRVRYGNAELTPERRRRLDEVIARLKI
jgi:protein-glutamine gamma-glutamyltransferase